MREGRPAARVQELQIDVLYPPQPRDGYRQAAENS
jgi:hypothetical protein